MQNLPLSVLSQSKITGRYSSGPHSLMILLADGWDVGEEKRSQTAVWTKNQGRSLRSLTAVWTKNQGWSLGRKLNHLCPGGLVAHL